MSSCPANSKINEKISSGNFDEVRLDEQLPVNCVRVVRQPRLQVAAWCRGFRERGSACSNGDFQTREMQSIGLQRRRPALVQSL